MKATGPNFQDLGQLILFSMSIQLFKNTILVYGPSIERTNMFFSGKLDVELSHGKDGKDGKERLSDLAV